MSSAPSRGDRRDAELAREVARRAIRRLDILESVMIAGGAVLALVGGAGIAWLLAALDGFAFGPTWVVASLILFVVPGAVAIFIIRRDQREASRRVAGQQGAHRAGEGKGDDV
jgi:uncharacterized membrane protein